MVKIGISGNIGSGKTTVCRVFGLLGIPVFYTDEAARAVMVTDNSLVEAIKLAFGAASYLENGELNRKHIADIVFNDENELAKLNALVHPATFRAFDSWAAQQEKTVPYVLKEAALLFETDGWKGCDKTIVVTSPLELRIERIMKRSGQKREDILSRESKQMPELQKARLADYIIVNDESELVIPEVLRLNTLFEETAGQK